MKFKIRLTVLIILNEWDQDKNPKSNPLSTQKKSVRKILCKKLKVKARKGYLKDLIFSQLTSIALIFSKMHLK